MSSAFGRGYGRYYDLLYQDKDYEAECDMLEELFQAYLDERPELILDAGCGTGGHAIPLAKRGYRVVGVDASEAMIARAREKAAREGLEGRVEFYVMDLRELALNRTFDACICMFAVLSYITENRDLVRVLANIREHLRPGGLFITDFWYGPAVLTIRPSVRVKVAEGERLRVMRFAHPHLDTLRHTCEVHYRLLVLRGRELVDEVKEVHVVRYFFPQELRHYLEERGFRLLKLCPFMDLEGEPSEHTWNVMAIAKAV